MNYGLSQPGAESVEGGEQTPHADAGAFTLSPRRGRGSADSADLATSATSAPAVDERSSAQGEKGGAADDSSAAMTLTASGARKVEAALVALNACEAESKIETQQVSNCQAGAEAGEAEVKRLQSSVGSLNSALAAKDEILARQQSEYKAELRAARGTFLGRLARTAEQVAIGVALGAAIGVAVK